MAKRPARLPDEDRTELLGLDELFVLKGRGDRNNLFAWQHEHEADSCPLCGGKVIKIQDRFSKTYFDYIFDDGRQRVISLTYEFFKYRCLNAECRHIFAKEIEFASKYDNVTYRLKNAISRKVIEGYSYSLIQHQFQDTISKQAIGQIFHRWLREKENLRTIQRPPASIAILEGQLDGEKYTLFLNLDEGISVYDIQLGVNSADIGLVLRKIGPGNIKTVLSDCSPVINDAIFDFLPRAQHIVPVELWLRSAIEEYRGFAYKTIKWSTIPQKEKLIMIPRSRIIYKDEYDLNRLLNARPAVVPAYEDYSRLLALIERRGELWVFEELQEWAEASCDDIKDCMGSSLYLLQEFGDEIKAQTQNRDAVPEHLSAYVSELEYVLSRAKIFSEDVLKARVLYAVESDLHNWRGIPIGKVIAALKEMNIETRRKRRDPYEYQ